MRSNIKIQLMICHLQQNLVDELCMDQEGHTLVLNAFQSRPKQPSVKQVED